MTATKTKPAYAGLHYGIDINDPRLHSFEGEGRSWATSAQPIDITKLSERSSTDFNPLW